MVVCIESIARLYTGIEDKTLGAIIMKLITAINALEKWRPIREWDDHINELPSTLKEEWNRILKAREEPMFKVSKQDVQDIVEAIQEDVPPSTVFRWYKINFTKVN